MNDDEVLEAVRGSVDRTMRRPRPPVLAIMARGRSRHRRRLAGLSLAGAAAAAAAAAAVAVGVTGAVSPSGSAPAGHTAAHLAAFTLTSNADGTTTLSISADQLLDPGTLRQALASRGIPALVTDGSFCSSKPEPAGYSQVVVGPQLRAHGPVPPPRPDRNPVALVIDGPAMPAGTELSIGYFDGRLQWAAVTLIGKNAYTCTPTPPTAPTPGGGALLGRHWSGTPGPGAVTQWSGRSGG